VGATVKRKGKRKAKRAARPRHADVEVFRRQFMAHKWPTVDAMAQAIGIPVDTVRKWTRGNKKTGEPGWLDQRKALDREGQQRADELLVQDTAEQIREMKQRHLAVLKELFFKAANQLTGKVKNPKTGKMELAPFETESQALHGLRLAIAGEQAILLRKTDPDGPGASFNGPTQILMAGSSTLDQAKRAMRELGENDLKAIIDMDPKGLDADQRAKKTGGGGDAGAAGGPAKRR
jgi:hypothetical protein